MSYEQIIVEQEGRVRLIFMNRPEKRNALSEKMAVELVSALEQADADQTVGAVLLTGKGDSFCAGGDLGDFAQMAVKTAPILHQEGAITTELFKIGQKLSKPVIAAVNGHAIGGGLGLAAACHLATANEKAKFGTPEIKVGIFPFVIFPLLIRAMGPRRALSMALTGRSINAAEARDIGLVYELFPPEELIDGTIKIASEIASWSPLVLKLGLNAYNVVMDMEINKAFDYLNTLRVIDFMSEDLKEGAMAFIQKRAPNWKGK